MSADTDPKLAGAVHETVTDVELRDPDAVTDVGAPGRLNAVYRACTCEFTDTMAVVVAVESVSSVESAVVRLA
jgi:hypothetical protein